MTTQENARLVSHHTETDSEKRHLIDKAQVFLKWITNEAASWFPHIAVAAQVILWSLGVAFSELLAGRIPELQLNCYRFLIQFLLILPVLLYHDHTLNVRVSQKDISWMGLICICSTTSNIGVFMASVYLPAGTLLGIYHTVIMIVIAVLSKVVLHEKIGISKGIAIIVTIIGIILVVQPSFIFHRQENIGPSYNLTCDSKVLHLNNFAQYINIDDIADTFTREAMGYTMIGLGAAIKAIYMLITTYRLKEMRTTTQSFWIALSGSITSFILMFIFEFPVFPTSSKCWLFLSLHATLVASGSVLLLYSIRHINPIIVSILQTFQIMFSFILQYTMLKHVLPGNYNWEEILGACLICMGILITAIHEFLVYNKVTQTDYSVNSQHMTDLNITDTPKSESQVHVSE